MDWYRIRHTIGLHMCSTAVRRAQYIRDHDLFYHMGNNCMTMFRKVPLYPKLISIGDNVWIASGVTFAPHDVIHRMLNNCTEGGSFREYADCIEIRDNVFIGTNTTILPGVRIGKNVIVAAGSLVNKDLPDNGVYGGVPAKHICSFEAFVGRREQLDCVTLEHGKKGLTADSVEKCWERFRTNHTERE